jgi:uncharacterized protein YecT (DUF1311 family)
MRTSIGFAVALLLVATVAHADDAPLYPKRNCDDLNAQIEMTTCAGDNENAADAALNTLYQKLMKAQDDAKSKAQLRDLERAWIAYRDKQCAFEIGPREESGSIWPMEMAMCMEQKTAARIRELTPLAACASGADKGCPPN